MATPESPQVSPVLTLHETSAGQYLLRLHKVSQNASLVSMLVQQLPGITQLIVVTPMDTKVFNVGDGGKSENGARRQIIDPHPIPNSQPTDLEDMDLRDPMEEALALAEEAEAPQDQPAPGTRRRKSGPSTAESPCGRCQGSGQVQTMMEGGEPAAATCPVCRGTGRSIKFGMNVRKGK